MRARVCSACVIVACGAGIRLPSSVIITHHTHQPKLTTTKNNTKTKNQKQLRARARVRLERRAVAAVPELEFCVPAQPHLVRAPAGALHRLEGLHVHQPRGQPAAAVGLGQRAEGGVLDARGAGERAEVWGFVFAGAGLCFVFIRCCFVRDARVFFLRTTGQPKTKTPKNALTTTNTPPTNTVLSTTCPAGRSPSPSPP